MPLTASARRALLSWGYRIVYDDTANRIVAYAPKDCRCLQNRVFAL